MKVLDEKGKLFGKINLIDLIVIVVLVLVVAAVGWKLAGSQITDAIANNNPTIRYEVVCPKIDPDACEFAVTQVGGQLMSNGDLLDGYITDCVIEPYLETVLDADGNVKQVEDPASHNLRFTIEAKVSEVANAYGLGSQELRVGKSHIVKTVELEFNGYITAMEEVTANE